jgi:hypothetical protein
MTELLLVGMFTAFCLAVLKPFIHFLSVLGGGLLINASFALVISSVAVYLVVDSNFSKLIVWAIAEGRSTAAAVDKYLIGETNLPSPIEPTSRPITV